MNSTFKNRAKHLKWDNFINNYNVVLQMYENNERLIDEDLYGIDRDYHLMLRYFDKIENVEFDESILDKYNVNTPLMKMFKHDKPEEYKLIVKFQNYFYKNNI